MPSLPPPQHTQAGIVQQSQRSLQNFAADLYKQQEPAALVSHLLSGLRSIIPTDYNSWKEIAIQPRLRVTATFSPHNLTAAALLPAFQRRFGDHPICNYWRRSGAHTGAFSWADVTTPSAFKSLGLYEEFYRPLGIRHQLAIALETSPSRLIYFALNRTRTPFTEHERQWLAALQPHASQALRHLQERCHLRSTLASFETLIHTLQQGVVCLSPEHRIRWANQRARAFLQTYWRCPSSSPCLPNPLLAWLLKNYEPGTHTNTVGKPLTIQHPHRCLTVRLLIEHNQRYLLFEEIAVPSAGEPFKKIGLTDRETEVLTWIAQGKSNDETALLLQICPQTVKKHLERIYAALSVSNRTEAALKAHELLRHHRTPS